MNLFSIQICFIIVNQLDRTWSKSINAEIDEFINRLMNSDKFDELADKIAEKAARKIFDLDNIRISHNIKTRNYETRTKQKELTENENISQAKEIKLKSTTKNVEYAKRNPAKGSHAPKEKLPLKFKNLSKGSRGKLKKHKIETDTQAHNKKIQSTKSEPVSEVTTERHSKKNRFVKVDSPHKVENEMKLKRKPDISVENTKYSAEGENEDNVDISENKKSNEDKRSTDDKDNKSNTDTPKDLDIDENIEKKANQLSNENNQSQNETVSDNESKYDNQSKENVSNEDPKPTEHETGNDSEKESKEKDTANIRKSFVRTTRNVIVRNEGGKLYAFENISDYQEYQEKVKKQKNNRKKIVLTY